MQMRNGRGLVAGLGVLALLLSSTPAWSGDDRPTESSSKKDENAVTNTPDSRVDSNAITAANAANPAADTPHVTYVPAMNGDRLLLLGPSGRKFQPFYSAVLSGAYDSHLAGTLASPGQGLFAVTPTLGFVGHGQQSQYVMQYSSTITELTGTPSGTESFHHGNFTARGEFTHAWGWDLGINGWYGVDALRLLAPLTFTNLLNIPTADAQAAVSQLGAQRTLNVGDNVGLHWQPTVRDRVAFSAYHSYYDFVDLSSHITYVGFNASYSRNLTRQTVLTVYNNFGRDTRTIPCTYNDLGVGLAMHPRPNLILQIGGGPTIGSPTCATRRGANFTASMGYQFTRFSTVYVTAGQRTNTPVNLPQSQTSRSFSAGYSRQMSRSLTLRLDGGYMYLGDFSNNVFVTSQGYFVAPQVEWKLTRSLSAELSYRNMSQLVGTSSLSRNQVLLSLTWRPQANGLYK
jgi:hypothetical protein